ncbi:MAG: hypothetical protein V9F00_00080 [Nocardioides sp.]
MTAGDKPSRASMSAKRDVNPATVTSQAANSPRPPARTLPSTLATTGLSSSTIWRNNATRPRHPIRRSALACTLGEVGTGTERVGRVGEHNGADGVVGLDVAKMPGEFSDQPRHSTHCGSPANPT